MFKDFVFVAVSLMITGLVIFSSCASGGDRETENSFLEDGKYAGEEQILILAQSAASSHNSQPWSIQKEEEGVYLVNAVPERWLRQVDPDKREFLLSLGAYLENLKIAAESFGFQGDVEIMADDADDENIARIRFYDESGTVDRKRITLMRSASMVKMKYRKSMGKTEILTELLEGDENVILVDRNEPVFDYIREGTVKANRQQVWNDKKQSELADYICFSQADEDQGVGMTPQMLNLPWFMSGRWYRKADRDSVMSKIFRNGTVMKAATLMKNCAGLILITSQDSSVHSLLECGGQFQRLYWDCKEAGIELHTVSQILEESPWKERLVIETGVEKPVQFVLRVGTVGGATAPVDAVGSASIRMP